MSKTYIKMRYLSRNELDTINMKKDRVVAPANCRHCYGRGTIGYNHKTKQQIYCRCICLEVDGEPGLTEVEHGA